MTLIHLNIAKVYQYKGVTLQWHRFWGPLILRGKTHEPRNPNNISNRVWGLVGQFSKLSDVAKENYRIN